MAATAASRDEESPSTRRSAIHPEVLRRIKDEMAKRGLTQKDVVDRARAQGYRLSHPSFNRILKGTQDPRWHSIRAIAAGIGIPANELMATAADAIPEPVQFERTVFIPAVTVLGGRWVPDPEGGKLPWPSLFLPPGARAVVFQLEDRAMEPELSPGDWVVVDVGRRKPLQGELVVLSNPVEGAARTLVGRAYGNPDSPDEWEFRDRAGMSTWGTLELVLGIVLGAYKRAVRISEEINGVPGGLGAEQPVRKRTRV